MKKENYDFIKKLQSQKKKANKLLVRTNVYIPDNNNIQNRRNNININRNRSHNNYQKKRNR